MVIANSIYEGEITLGRRLKRNAATRRRIAEKDIFVDQRTKRPRSRWYNKQKRKEKLDPYIASHADELREYHRAYRAAHREESKAYQAGYRKVPRNQKRRKETMSRYYQENKDALRAGKRRHYSLNKEAICAKTSERKKSDPCFKLKCAMRGRVYDVLTRGSKSAKTMELIGCSAQFLKGHLEKQFTPEMSWENYGTYWEVHHIIACAEFPDLTDPKQQRKCFHFSNLAPLDCSANRSLGAKVQFQLGKCRK